MILITCPHCGFSREVARERLPRGTAAAKVTCPRCQRFFFWREQAHGQVFQQERSPLRQMTTSKHFAGYRGDTGEEREDISFEAQPTMEKAGFWLRCVAALIDTALISMVQFILVWLLKISAEAVLSGPGVEHLKVITLAFFNFALWQTYKVVFTGYGGQTPGKMAMRIKVLRVDGDEIGFTRAFLREVIGKFISSVLFGLGFLMIAFDRDKQGLHDRLAATYVIKL